jgi:hypothetical protein
MKTIQGIALIVTALFVLAPFSSFAQGQPADNMQILREKLRAEKKLVVAQNMQLTQSEAKGFWPIYNRYQKDLTKLLKRLKKLIENYTKNSKTMDDKLAKRLIGEWLTYQEDQLKLQRAYLPKFRSTLSDVKVFRYYQLEGKIDTVIRYELSSKIPLAQK